MRVLDLFAGELGWTRVFAARGWECVAVDLVEPSRPKVDDWRDAWHVRFQQYDVLSLYWEAGAVWGTSHYGVPVCLMHQPDFIVASSVCDGFASFGMKHFQPDPPYPEMEIRLFNHTRALCEASGTPYVMENVRAAQQFVGPAENHCGPFFLWGSAVPPLLPQGISKARWKANKLHGRTAPGNFAPELLLGKRDRKAKLATIPPELANCVAAYAERLLEQPAEQRRPAP